MESLDKLEQRINGLVEQFDKLATEKSRIDQENAQLKERVKALESELKTLQIENQNLDKRVTEKNEIALKRISRLVDKIDQFQTEMKIS